MKKFISCFLTLALGLAGLTGCGSQTATETDSDTISVVATIFPEYDWARQLVGEVNENVELTLLCDSGVDLHNFEPTVSDILTVANADIFIYVGGESDEWVEDALAQSTKENQVVINLLEALGSAVVEEEVVEGMEAEEEEEEGEEGEEEEVEYDEHVWLSLRNAQACCQVIYEALAQVDADNAEAYAANLTSYTAELADLDSQYAEVVAAASSNTLLFGDRFPFRYLCDDYGLTYYAAFVGCSSETEASFETVVFLAEKMDELNLDCVLTLESSDHEIAQTIIANTASGDQTILTMNSMQSVTASEVEDGYTYVGLVQDNLEILRIALG